jgi:hypothetical protein
MRTLDEIQNALSYIRIESRHPRPQLTIILNKVGLIAIMSDKRKVIDTKARPMRLMGIPYTIDDKQHEKFRIVKR